jgi:DNA polymerase-3 subunit beta
MEIRVNRSQLLNELAPMQGIVERRTTIPVLSHILLRGEQGHLYLAATDLDVSLKSRCSAEVTVDGAIAVQAKKFLEIVRAVTDTEISLTVKDEKRLEISAGKSQFKINGLSPEDFPTLPQVEQENAIEIPFADLKKMVSKIFFAVSAEESRFQLNGALLKIREGALEMVATDGHRLALVENKIDSPEAVDEVLVPRKALQELQRFEGDGKLVFSRGEHHLSFKFSGRELLCRILEGTFPDYERVIAKDNDKNVTFDRKNLSAAIQRVALLTGDRARAVRLNFESSRLLITATNPDLGEAVEEVECDYSGEPLHIGLNPDYMTHFLGVLDTDEVRFEIKDDNTQCVGYPVSGEDERYLCVIMPMRV